MADLLVLSLLLLGTVAACAQNGPPVDPPGGAGRSLPRSSERATERERMVVEQIEARGVHEPLVLAALRAVPRHWFVPEAYEAAAYDDGPLPIGSGQTISQPFIVARMTEALELRPTDCVLDIGTGSGYQAAVLAEITPHVFSIEIVPELADAARARLAARGYSSVEVRQGDGWLGWPERAPFDAILLAAAPATVPPALLAQLAPGGRLCLPVGGRDESQELQVFTRQPDGSFASRRLEIVRFVPMTGQAERRN